MHHQESGKDRWRWIVGSYCAAMLFGCSGDDNAGSQEQATTKADGGTATTKADGDAATTADGGAATTADIGAPTTVDGAGSGQNADASSPAAAVPMGKCNKTDLSGFVIHNAKERKALCNDGSEAVYYVRKGLGKNAKKWTVHLRGGGACHSLCSCDSRWMSSPAKMKQTGPCKSTTGLNTANKKKNPGFYDWTHVFVEYCSSDSHGGDVEQKRDPAEASKCPTVAKGAPASWQFRGHRIVKAVFEDLTNANLHPDHNLTQAELVLFTGSSAGSGGLRRNLDWAHEFVKAKAPALKEFRGVVDAAWIVTPPPADGLCDNKLNCLKAVQQYLNLQFDASCTKNYAKAPWTCMDTFHEWPELTTPHFIYMDQADQNSLKKVGVVHTKGVFSDEAKAKINAFAKQVVTAATTKDGIRDGVYLSRLGYHTALYAPGERFFAKMINGLSLHDVLHNWLAGKKPSSAVDDRPVKKTNWSSIAKNIGNATAASEKEGHNTCACEK